MDITFDEEVVVKQICMNDTGPVDPRNSTETNVDVSLDMIINSWQYLAVFVPL